MCLVLFLKRWEYRMFSFTTCADWVSVHSLSSALSFWLASSVFFSMARVSDYMRREYTAQEEWTFEPVWNTEKVCRSFISRSLFLTRILCSSCWAYLTMAIVSSSLLAVSFKKVSKISWSQCFWFLNSSNFSLALKIWFCGYRQRSSRQI